MTGNRAILPRLPVLLSAALLALSTGCATRRDATDLSAIARSDDGSLRLQILLDREGFGPGKLDAAPGEFTRKAVAEFIAARGHSPLDRRFPDSIRSVRAATTTYTIQPRDLRQIGAVPEANEERAKLPALLYGSLLEFVAERFHSSRALIAQLNRGIDMNRLGPGVTLAVPAVAPFEIENLPRGAVSPAPDRSSRHVQIDTPARILRVREGARTIAAFPITPGSRDLPAPQGTWKIVSMYTFPNFRWDDKMLNEGVRGDVFFLLPPGPNSPVGIFWAGISKSGVGIHGTSWPESIGRSTSHGCIRLANWDAVRFSRLVNVGATVRIDVTP